MDAIRSLKQRAALSTLSYSVLCLAAGVGGCAQQRFDPVLVQQDEQSAKPPPPPLPIPLPSVPQAAKSMESFTQGDSGNQIDILMRRIIAYTETKNDT